MDWLVSALGYLRTIVSGLPAVLTVLIGVAATAFTLMPRRASELEKWMEKRPWRVRIVSLSIIALGVWGFIEQQSAGNALQSQLSRLVAASTTQATAEDVRGLRQEFRDGVERMVSAVESLRRPGTSAAPTQAMPSATETPAPAVVRHVRFTERRIASDDPEFPYGLQIIVQTDVTTQPTALEMHFDGPIEKADFFVVGQPVTINVRTSLGANRQAFQLAFGFPAWTPESPIVVTVYSKQSVRVTAIGTP